MDRYREEIGGPDSDEDEDGAIEAGKVNAFLSYLKVISK
jgi:hypothetical protein